MGEINLLQFSTSKSYKYKKEGMFAVLLYGKPLANICMLSILYTRKLIFDTAVMAVIKSSRSVGIPVYKMIQTLTSGYKPFKVKI